MSRLIFCEAEQLLPWGWSTALNPSPITDSATSALLPWQALAAHIHSPHPSERWLERFLPPSRALRPRVLQAAGDSSLAPLTLRSLARGHCAQQYGHTALAPPDLSTCTELTAFLCRLSLICRLLAPRGGSGHRDTEDTSLTCVGGHLSTELTPSASPSSSHFLLHFQLETHTFLLSLAGVFGEYWFTLAGSFPLPLPWLCFHAHFSPWLSGKGRMMCQDLVQLALPLSCLVAMWLILSQPRKTSASPASLTQPFQDLGTALQRCSWWLELFSPSHSSALSCMV